jgi:hypothetical protein
MLHVPPRRLWPRVSRRVQAGLRVKVSMIAAPREVGCALYMKGPRRCE